MDEGSGFDQVVHYPKDTSASIPDDLWHSQQARLTADLYHDDPRHIAHDTYEDYRYESRHPPIRGFLIERHYKKEALQHTSQHSPLQNNAKGTKKALQHSATYALN